MALRLVNTSSRYTDEQGDTQDVRLSFDMSARDRKSILRNRVSRRWFVLELIGTGELDQPGRCQCSHCLNDWDCCGRLVPGTIKVQPRRGGLYVVQTYDRNV